MLGGNIIVFEKLSHPMRNFQHTAQLRSYVNLVSWGDNGRALNFGHIFKNSIAEEIYVHFQFVQNGNHSAFVLQNKGGQKMQDINLILSSFYRQLMSLPNGFLSFDREI